MALTRPRRVGVTEARATNTTTNGKSTDWGKGNFSDIRHQYTRIRKVYKFHGGNISSQIFNWKRITKDKEILDIIHHGLKLQIVDNPVTNAPSEHPRSIDETAIIDGEI